MMEILRAINLRHLEDHGQVRIRCCYLCYYFDGIFCVIANLPYLEEFWGANARMTMGCLVN